jgi:hypothetical protein
MPVLVTLCRPHEWIAVDDASGEPVDLVGTEPAGWEWFRAYRDRAIRSIQTSEDHETLKWDERSTDQGRDTAEP